MLILMEPGAPDEQLQGVLGVLAAAGLLAETHPGAALRLMRQSIADAFPESFRSKERQ